MKSVLSVSNREFKQQQLDKKTIMKASRLFQEHGALWLKNALSRRFVGSLAKAYASKYTSQSPSQLKKKNAVVGERRYMVTVAIESPFNHTKLYASPLVLPILHSLLGTNCSISSFGSVVAFPGSAAQPIHIDHPPLFDSEKQCSGLPAYAITLVVPLIDIEKETGSTAIWEGSHAQMGARKQLQRLIEKPNWNGATYPLPRIGDVYLMDYRVIHGGMANESEHPRPILYIVYGRPWFRDAYNFLDQPPVVLAANEFKKIPKQHRGLFAGHHPD